MNIVFLFPTNYLHGQPSEKYYREEVPIMSISPRTQSFLSDIFKDSLLYRKFTNLFLRVYIEWISLGNDVFKASPRITVYHDKDVLKYFHNPTYNSVKFDFFKLTGRKSEISNSHKRIVEGNPSSIDGKYIVSLINGAFEDSDDEIFRFKR